MAFREMMQLEQVHAPPAALQDLMAAVVNCFPAGAGIQGGPSLPAAVVLGQHRWVTHP